MLRRTRQFVCAVFCRAIDKFHQNWYSLFEQASSTEQTYSLLLHFIKFKEDTVRYFGINTTEPAAVSNQLLTKENNAKLLFNIVSQQGSISRAALAKVSGLSPSTVSVLTEELIDKRILLEAGIGESAPTGRKPIMLQVDPDGLQIPCFAFCPNGLQFILYNLKFECIESLLIPYSSELERKNNNFITPSNEAILKLFSQLRNRSAMLDMKKVRLIAVSFYGAFLRDTSMYASSILGWYLSSSFVDSLRELFDNTPLLVGNNANLLAYAEKSIHCTDRDNLLYIHLDRGVGSGLILDNRPVTGECGIAGEIGHMLIGGKRLEDIASSDSVLLLLRKESGITSLKAAGEALQLGDTYTTELLRSVAADVATAINNVLCMLGSMDVFIGGEVATALGPVFLDLLRGAIQQFGYRRVLPHSPIRMSCLPEHGDTLGAARAYVDNVFTVILP